jgi:hypothetical protein
MDVRATAARRTPGVRTTLTVKKLPLWRWPWIALSVVVLVAACDATPEPEPEPAPSYLDEVRDAGLLKYLDEGAVPTSEVIADRETVYRFGPDDGPLCMRGKPYSFTIRDRGSDKLLLFLQGGGACWSDFCLAVKWPSEGVPVVEALDEHNPSNPMADWNVAYLPYCDGSLFAGDADVDEDGDGEPDRLHRGLQNLSGVLRTVREVYPNPEQVLLTGSSAGAFGTIPASMLVRATYPETRLQVFNDSGVGVARTGEPEFINAILDEHGITPLLPQSCESCSGDGHITRLVRWILERDTELEIAMFSALHDSVMTDIFLQIEDSAFEEALLEETGRLHDLFPDRYRRFLIQGKEHTVLLGNPTGVIGDDLDGLEYSDGALAGLANITLGGLDRTDMNEFTVGTWLRAFVERTDAWTDRVESAAP